MLKVGTPVVIEYHIDNHFPGSALALCESSTRVAGTVIDHPDSVGRWFALDRPVKTQYTDTAQIWHEDDIILVLPLVQVKHTPSLPSIPVPRVDPKLLKEETKKIARSQYGPAVLRTGEKISYKHGVGYLYTHSYSETGLRKTLLTWAKGEKL